MPAALIPFALRNWLPIAGILVAVLVAFAAWHSIRSGAFAEARAATLEQTFIALKKRIVIDEKVRRMPDADLCSAIGGKLQPSGKCE